MSREVHVQVLREAGGAIPPAYSPDQARQSAAAASGQQDQKWPEGGSAVRLPAAEIDPALQGPDSPTDVPPRAGDDSGVDPRDQSRLARLGRVLQACSRPRALPSTRWLDRAAPVVASVPALAL